MGYLYRREEMEEEFDIEIEESVFEGLEIGRYPCTLCEQPIFHSIKIIMVCGHVFHSNCLEHWLQTENSCVPRCGVPLHNQQILSVAKPQPVDVEDSEQIAGPS